MKTFEWIYHESQLPKPCMNGQEAMYSAESAGCDPELHGMFAKIGAGCYVLSLKITTDVFFPAATSTTRCYDSELVIAIHAEKYHVSSGL